MHLYLYDNTDLLIFLCIYTCSSLDDTEFEGRDCLTWCIPLIMYNTWNVVDNL